MDDECATRRECEQHRAELRRETLQAIENSQLQIKYELSELMNLRMDKLEVTIKESISQRIAQSNIRHDETDKRLDLIMARLTGVISCAEERGKTQDEKLDSFIVFIQKWGTIGFILIVAVLGGVVMGRGFDYYLAFLP